MRRIPRGEPLGNDAGGVVQIHQAQVWRGAPHPADVALPPPLPEEGLSRDQDRDPFLDHLAAAGGHDARDAQNPLTAYGGGS